MRQGGRLAMDHRSVCTGIGGSSSPKTMPNASPKVQAILSVGCQHLLLCKLGASASFRQRARRSRSTYVTTLPNVLREFLSQVDRPLRGRWPKRSPQAQIVGGKAVRHARDQRAGESPRRPFHPDQTSLSINFPGFKIPSGSSACLSRR